MDLIVRPVALVETYVEFIYLAGILCGGYAGQWKDIKELGSVIQFIEQNVLNKSIGIGIHV